jgi:hypothetical protein
MEVGRGAYLPSGKCAPTHVLRRACRVQIEELVPIYWARCVIARYWPAPLLGTETNRNIRVLVTIDLAGKLRTTTPLDAVTGIAKRPC